MCVLLGFVDSIMKTLFNCCLHFVSEHIDCVDTLCGFPENIGELLFKLCDKRFKFDICASESLSAISLFGSAYSECLKKLNIDGNHLLLVECLSHLQKFIHLSAFSLTSCFLGDYNDIILGFSHFNSLQILVLSDNNLSDEGVRYLTIPLRLQNTGPVNLQILDLSDNAKITHNCLKFLKIFKSIQLIKFSRTSMQSTLTSFGNVIHAFEKSCKLQIKSMQDGCILQYLNSCIDVETVGWAEATIKRWALQCKKNRYSGDQINRSCMMGKIFYGSVRKKCRTVDLFVRKKQSRACDVPDVFFVSEKLWISVKQCIKNNTDMCIPQCLGQTGDISVASKDIICPNIEDRFSDPMYPYIDISAKKTEKYPNETSFTNSHFIPEQGISSKKRDTGWECGHYPCQDRDGLSQESTETSFSSNVNCNRTSVSNTNSEEMVRQDDNNMINKDEMHLLRQYWS